MPGSSTHSAETTGVILAGGASSRFGSNKALALLHGKPIIAHVAATLENIFADRLLVTNAPHDFNFLGWPMVGDIHINCGPLAGIHAALSAIDKEQAFIVGCDMPKISSRLISFVCRLQGDWDVALPWLDKGPEPLFALYRKSCLPVIEKQLLHKQSKIQLALQQLQIRRLGKQEIVAITGDLSSFHNINRESDLQLIQGQMMNKG